MPATLAVEENDLRAEMDFLQRDLDGARCGLGTKRVAIMRMQRIRSIMNEIEREVADSMSVMDRCESMFDCSGLAVDQQGRRLEYLGRQGYHFHFRRSGDGKRVKIRPVEVGMTSFKALVGKSQSRQVFMFVRPS